MNVAKNVIAKFGGQTALAKLIGKRQSTVQHWTKIGLIPAKWQPKILDIAASRGIFLNPSDFIPSIDHPERESTTPIARWPGVLRINEGDELPCFVLDDGRRIISRTGATSYLTNRTGGGNLEHYLETQAVKPYLPKNISEKMIEFFLPEVTNKKVRGITAEDFLLICKAYALARDTGSLTTDKQIAIAIKASMFLSACSKIGLIALIDEATGYQYERQQDALQVKLRLFLEEEMRKWERTFPEELWMEFGRLTHWDGSVNQRPKYWGKLVVELIYEYLDPDVADWLKKHVPDPQHGRNYHQWLSGQYGLKRLVEHIWMVIGIAKTCFSIYELKEKMAAQYGREPYQFSLFLPPPTKLIKANIGPAKKSIETS